MMMLSTALTASVQRTWPRRLHKGVSNRSIQVRYYFSSELSNAHRIVDRYPDLDCVFPNSGVQNQVRLSRPAEVDLDDFHQEVSTNFNRLVDLSVKFLPHLQKKPVPTALIVTGTLLAHVPAVVMSAYSASKAALAAYVNCLRRQNKASSTKIIEMWPPVVQTELHDYLAPQRGRAMGMPVGEFIGKVWPPLAAGEEHVIIGAIGPEEDFLDSVKWRREQFEVLSGHMLSHFQL
ncbi:hypothetical protein FALCPG4_017064 [Fusarium falciforme]